MSATSQEIQDIVRKNEYSAGFITDVQSDTVPPGLSEDTIRFISAKKGEPQWLLDWRLKAYARFLKMTEPKWAHVHYAEPNLQSISYYSDQKCQKIRSNSFRKFVESSHTVFG